MKNKWFDWFVITRSGLFDARYYLSEYRDCRLADVDPLLHFINHGWQEGRNPSQSFNTKYYLNTYPDIKKAGINPLAHYIRFGKKEGRSINYAPAIARGPRVGWGDFTPKITVIVPNYNYAVYLEERLASIYNQTYPNIEVLLLDDCSTDDSLAILKRYQAQYPEKTHLIVNEANSGSPFSQWSKGISLTSGKLIWIAESDDTCDLDFLENLVPYFLDESILLSYAHTIFIDENANRHPFTFEYYVSQIDPHKWDASYVVTAQNEVNTALALLNTIPNVSSAVFRRIEGDFPILSNPDWLKMKVCGDWLFYLHLIQGGRVAYCRETHAYYRLHESSTSKKTHTQDVYYQEHEKVACAVASLYRVSDNLLTGSEKRLREFYFQTVKSGTNREFNTLFDIRKVLQCKQQRAPNIMMATFGFIYGGGEIFPIRLANAIRDKGLSVTMFNGNYEPMQPGVRDMLYAHIPVINNTYPNETAAAMEELGIEVVHSHHASMESHIGYLRKNFPIHLKHIATMHGMYEMMDDFDLYTRDILNSVDFWFYTADKNIAPFTDRGLFAPEKFTKIDNGIQAPESRKADLSPLGITPDSFVACLASRALREKGWMEAITAVGNVREITRQDVHLLLIGGGPLYDELKGKKLPEYVHLMGSRSNVSDYLAASQLGLVPSYFKGESFPFVMIECFMAEIPVVASIIGETRNMITLDEHNQAGLLIELRDGKVDPQDLARAIIKLCTDSEFYNQCTATTRLLKKRFDINVIADQYLEEYKRQVGI